MVAIRLSQFHLCDDAAVLIAPPQLCQSVQPSSC